LGEEKKGKGKGKEKEVRVWRASGRERGEKKMCSRLVVRGSGKVSGVVWGEGAASSDTEILSPSAATFSFYQTSTNAALYLKSATDRKGKMPWEEHRGTAWPVGGCRVTGTLRFPLRQKTLDDKRNNTYHGRRSGHLTCGAETSLRVRDKE
jgi:hypothetical protein